MTSNDVINVLQSCTCTFFTHIANRLPWPTFSLAIDELDAAELDQTLDNLVIKLQPEFHVIWADYSTRLTADFTYGKRPIPARNPSIHALVTSRRGCAGNPELLTLVARLQEMCRTASPRLCQSRTSRHSELLTISQVRSWDQLHPPTASWFLRYPRSPFGSGFFGAIPETKKPISQLLEHLAKVT